MKGKFIILIAVILAMLPVAHASAGTSAWTTSSSKTREARVVAETMSLYAEPETDSRYQDRLQSGDTVSVLSTQNGWSRISYSHEGLACLHLAYVHSSDLSYKEKMIGFVTGETKAHSLPNEFSSGIGVGIGFPVYVIGEANGFYAVENHAGQLGYILKTKLSPTVPAGGNPFYGGYDPKWENAEEWPLLMLPQYATLYKSANYMSQNFQIQKNTPCYVVRKKGDFYLVSNTDKSATAYVHKGDLIPTMAVSLDIDSRRSSK